MSDYGSEGRGFESLPARKPAHAHSLRPSGGSSDLDFSLATTFDPEAELPPASNDTGFTREGWHLWVDDSRIDRAVWLVNGDTVERWPATTEVFGCA